MKNIILTITLAFLTSFHAMAAQPGHPAVQGCLELTTMQFEDGASYYKGIDAKILRPLRKKHSPLAKFLESSLITVGDMQVTVGLCHHLAVSL